MVVHGQPEMKQKILQNTKSLKCLKNEHDDYYYINKQLPEQLVERDQENRAKIAQIKQNEAHLSKGHKSKIKIQSGILYINNEPMHKPVLPPDPKNIFTTDIDEKKAINSFKLACSKTHGKKAASS